MGEESKAGYDCLTISVAFVVVLVRCNTKSTFSRPEDETIVCVFPSRVHGILEDRER